MCTDDGEAVILIKMVSGEHKDNYTSCKPCLDTRTPRVPGAAAHSTGPAAAPRSLRSASGGECCVYKLEVMDALEQSRGGVGLPPCTADSRREEADWGAEAFCFSLARNRCADEVRTRRVAAEDVRPGDQAEEVLAVRGQSGGGGRARRRQERLTEACKQLASLEVGGKLRLMLAREEEFKNYVLYLDKT
ncbi:unnamed protein product [Chrysodeixis includens]|uniref:Uncharacterized protein n=1 Tax=Chrysodeixis includens TaxID=689277 RepID=A0A9N8KNZ6_CHRIL|nr:unnamed protein product [Chrysodeixis includens]